MATDRVYLTVLFAEKDEVKALGARWDQDKKAWWVAPQADPRRFARWLRPGSDHAPVYLDLDQVRWAIEDIELMQQANSLGGVTVFFTPYSCWKCRESGVVFHGATGEDYGIELTDSLYWPDVLTEIDAARAAFNLPRMGVIKPRYSKTVGGKYVSQGCAHCDALFGTFPLHEDFIALSSEYLEKHKYKMRPHWPPQGLAEWIEDHEEGNSYDELGGD